MKRLLTATFLLILATTATAGPSNSLLDLTPNGKLLAVANTDAGTVTLVDLVTKTKLAEIPVGDHPEGVCWIANGTKLLVTVYGDNVVKVIDPSSKSVVNKIKVLYEPYGVVARPDATVAYVSHDYPGVISEIDLTTNTVKRTLKSGPGCRGLALSPDGKTVYSTEFWSGKLHAHDLATGKETDSWTGIETDNLSRNVVVHPTQPRAYLAHLRSRTSVFSARGSIEPELSIIDLGPKKTDEKRRLGIALDTFNGVFVMANPWESAISPDGSMLYVIYAGSNDANAIRLLPEYPYVKRTTLPNNVGKHPRAVRVSPDGNEVYIYNTLDFSVGIYTPALKKTGSITVCDPPKTAEWRRGKELFVSALQPMGGTKWISCSTCHPDGLTDGRVWQNPDGPRRTPHLFGLAHTHPLHWSADRDEVQDFEYTIRGKLMQGRGLTTTGPLKPKEVDEVLAGKSKDLDALALYTNSFGFRLSPHIPAPGKLSDSAERGKTLFFSKETNCASCHSGPYYTDSSMTKPFKLHDVGTGGGENEKLGPGFDTPTLLGVFRMGPYMHDGRAKTLDEVLTMNPGDKHGKTSQLSKPQRDDLVEFMKSLPYEMPPEKTPNTVTR